MHACCHFYVGNNTVDKNTNMIEVCREISKLKQEYRDIHGRVISLTPEEVFLQFLAYADSMSDCARGWLIQLCLTYYIAFSGAISNCMMSNGT